LPRTPPPSPAPLSATLNPTQQGDKATVKSPSGSVKVEPSGHPTSSIKSEEPAYEPPQALRDEIARLNGSGLQPIVRVKEEQISKDYVPQKTPVGFSDAQSLSVKQEPRDVQSETPAIGPSQALLNEWSRLQSQQRQHIGPATPIKRETGYTHPTAQLPTVPQSPRATGSREHTSREQQPSFERIKREPTAGEGKHVERTVFYEVTTPTCEPPR